MNSNITFDFPKMKDQANTDSQSNKKESDASHDPTFSVPLICLSFTAGILKKKISTINKIASFVLNFLGDFTFHKTNYLSYFFICLFISIVVITAFLVIYHTNFICITFA